MVDADAQPTPSMRYASFAAVSADVDGGGGGNERLRTQNRNTVLSGGTSNVRGGAAAGAGEHFERPAP